MLMGVDGISFILDFIANLHGFIVFLMNRIELVVFVKFLYNLLCFNTFRSSSGVF